MRTPLEVKAVFYQADALYNLCNFEYSLLAYQRGASLAPYNMAFQRGLIKCRKTITGRGNC